MKHYLLYRHWTAEKDQKKIIICAKRRFWPWAPEEVKVFLNRGPGFLWEDVELDSLSEVLAQMTELRQALCQASYFPATGDLFLVGDDDPHLYHSP